MTGIPVLAAPAIDPGTARIEMIMPVGMTVADIVAAALPGASHSELVQARVALVSEHGSSVIMPAHWKSVRPRPGVRVVIRIVPGKMLCARSSRLWFRLRLLLWARSSARVLAHSWGFRGQLQLLSVARSFLWA